MENSLPQGWVECSLGEILTAKKGKKPSSVINEPRAGYVPYILIDEMEGKPIRNYTNDPKVSIIDETEVLLVWDGSIGKCGSGMKGAIGSTLVGLKALGGIQTKFLEYTIKQQNNFIKETSTGTGLQHINKDFFEICKIPLPPLAEQNRIVAKLDAVMQKVESNKQRLEKIPKLLKRFRQSVLAAAVSGKLTEEWREKNNLKGWLYERAEDVCDLITKGTTPKEGGLTKKGEIPFLKVYNIVDQKIDFNYKPQYVSNEIHNNFLKRSRVYPGDVLMNIVGPPLGKVAIVPDSFEEWNINQAIAIFRAKKNIIPGFIYVILCEGTPITEIEKEYRGTAGQSNISLEQCRNFILPIPEVEEQKEIVRRVEQLLAFADKLEARYTKAKAMLDKLPQGILAKAFRGELVEQDPEHEPASVLLERIKDEKAKLKAEKKGKKSSKEKVVKKKKYKDINSYLIAVNKPVTMAEIFDAVPMEASEFLLKLNQLMNQKIIFKEVINSQPYFGLVK